MFTLRRKTAGEAIFDAANVAGMSLICFVTIYPIWYVLVNAFNEGQDAVRGGIYWWPRGAEPGQLSGRL